MNAPLVLASASPRRAELLRQAGIGFTVAVPGIDEDKLRSDILSPAGFAMALARAKAQAVAVDHPGAFVLGADTIVVLDDEILGKPTDGAEAERMLGRLSGRAHEVITGVCLLAPRSTERPVRDECTRFATATVWFGRWSAAARARMAGPTEALDKAGAYGIQGLAGAYVERIDGSYATVVGLPIELVGRMLQESGYSTD